MEAFRFKIFELVSIDPFQRLKVFNRKVVFEVFGKKSKCSEVRECLIWRFILSNILGKVYILQFEAIFCLSSTIFGVNDSKQSTFLGVEKNFRLLIHSCRFFSIFSKVSIRFEQNFLQSFYTILESYMCNGIKIVWLGCEKINPKMAKKTAIFLLFPIFSKTLYTIRTKFSTVILRHNMVL